MVAVPGPLQAPDPRALCKENRWHSEPRLDEPGGHGEKQPARHPDPPGDVPVMEMLVQCGQLAPDARDGTEGTGVNVLDSADDPGAEAFLARARQRLDERFPLGHFGELKPALYGAEDGISATAEGKGGCLVGDSPLGVAPVKPQEPVGDDLLDANVPRVFKAEQRPVVVPSSDRPAGDFLEGQGVVRPLARSWAKADLPREHDPMVGDESLSSRQDCLTRLELGQKIRHPLRHPTTVVLNRLAAPSPALRPKAGESSLKIVFRLHGSQRIFPRSSRRA